MTRPKRNYRRPMRREVPEHPATGHTFLIVVEGEQTEPIYFDSLRRKLRLRAADVVVIHPEATDPKNLVEAAIQRRDQRDADAGKSAMKTPYDEVWVVFDREAQNHPRREQIPPAIALAANEKISVALSNPAFEFWLLLHFSQTTRPFADARAVMRALREFLPEYSKGDYSMDLLCGKLGTAIKNAEFCMAHHEGCDGDGNPSTQVHLLVKALNMAVVPGARLI